MIFASIVNLLETLIGCNQNCITIYNLKVVLHSKMQQLQFIFSLGYVVLCCSDLRNVALDTIHCSKV